MILQHYTITTSPAYVRPLMPIINLCRNTDSNNTCAAARQCLKYRAAKESELKEHILNSQGIKGPPYRFIHGNSKEAFKMKREALSKPMGLTHDIFPKVQPHVYSWTNRYEPELVKEVLKNSEKVYPKKKNSIYLSKLMGNGLVSVEGEKWVRQRKLANYVFHGESLKNMTPAVIASVETMLEKWKGQEGKEIEVFQECRLFTSEVISRTAFGSSYLEGEKIFDMLSKLSIIAGRNAFNPSIPIIKYVPSKLN
ncbi:hypothetical protein V6N11_061070 [Hibiscus sabdariffa]|uniref:Cytochrome P450 CYP749A22-like n=1 Tax=Hibiscus sabdariffa TaxID=183260 RepID=A0ABR2QS35_9ROSI